MRRLALTTTLVLVIALAAVAGAQPAAQRGEIAVRIFRTPSNNIACLYMPASRRTAAYLRCDILSGLRPKPRAACNLDWTGFTMGLLGRALPNCAGDTVYMRRAPILRYGRTWRRGGFVCVSRRSGLRCTNKDRHGFFLSRQRSRIF